jgi:hypothetical protein
MNGGFLSFQAFAGLESPSQELISSSAWLSTDGSGNSGSSGKSGGLPFKPNIPSGHKKAKGTSLSDWRSPAGRDALNQFCFFI